MCSRDWLPFNYTFVISLFFVFGAKIAQSLFFFVKFFLSWFLFFVWPRYGLVINLRPLNLPPVTTPLVSANFSCTPYR
jgi:hypothetical protein